MNKKEAILIFGGGFLQKSIIENAKYKGLFTVVIDPDKDAYCKDIPDVFRVIKGDDFEGTVEVAEEFNVKGIITSATDKPLRMMARVANKLKLPFFSEETAINTTDKLLMKKVFMENNIPCALGIEVSNPLCYNGQYPVIIKPRDNSGSRGVILVKDKEKLKDVFKEVIQFTKKDTVLVEEFIEGQEYSIEAIHNEGKHIILQYTEKTTTPFPYNVEISHKQPADFDYDLKTKINLLIKKIGIVFNYENCVSHTELKVTKSGKIYIIETSPRLGGDFITSHLVPLSTNINMESIYLDVALGKRINLFKPQNKASLILFFNEKFNNLVDKSFFVKLDSIKKIEGVKKINFDLKLGGSFPIVKSSLDRYGYVILSSDNRKELLEKEQVIIETLRS